MRLPRTLTPIVFTLILLVWPALVHADFQAGVDAHNQGDYTTALEKWLPLAEGENEKAQIRLSLLYFMGKECLKIMGKPFAGIGWPPIFFAFRGTRKEFLTVGKF